jgi:16S rRNA (guanine1207-N2)-methyltransferase
MRKSKRHARPITDLFASVATRVRSPIGIVLGAPGEVVELVCSLPDDDITCWQMDLFQADRLSEALRLRNRSVTVETSADLWDWTAKFQTLIYPVAYGGERALKLDFIEQAHHALQPQGVFIVLSPYENDDFFGTALKKVFGRPHVPMDGDNQVFWCKNPVESPRRRHEMSYHVRVDAETSYSFLSRPGVFGYGFYDEGARALMEVAELTPGQRVLDLGCGVGTNGILAARKVGPEGHVTFVDSNVRAVALAEINARAIGVKNYQTLASHTLKELSDASFDVVLANPPYYAQGSIIHHFIERSHAVLRPGGFLYLVTKMVDIAWPMIQERFGEPELFENRGYMIFRVQK